MLILQHSATHSLHRASPHLSYTRHSMHPRMRPRILLRQAPLHLAYNMRLTTLTIHIIIPLTSLRSHIVQPILPPTILIQIIHAQDITMIHLSHALPPMRCHIARARLLAKLAALSFIIVPTAVEFGAVAAVLVRAGEVGGTGFYTYETGFKGVDEEFEEGEAGGDDAEGDDGLGADGGDPEVVDEVGGAVGFGAEVVELEDGGGDGAGGSGSMVSEGSLLQEGKVWVDGRDLGWLLMICKDWTHAKRMQ